MPKIQIYGRSGGDVSFKLLIKSVEFLEILLGFAFKYIPRVVH